MTVDLRSYCDLMQAFFVLDDDANNLPTDVVIERYEATRQAVLHVDTPRPEGEHVIGELTRQYAFCSFAFKFRVSHSP